MRDQITPVRQSDYATQKVEGLTGTGGQGLRSSMGQRGGARAHAARNSILMNGPFCELRERSEGICHCDFFSRKRWGSSDLILHVSPVACSQSNQIFVFSLRLLYGIASVHLCKIRRFLACMAGGKGARYSVGHLYVPIDIGCAVKWIHHRFESGLFLRVFFFVRKGLVYSQSIAKYVRGLVSLCVRTGYRLELNVP